MRLSIRLLVRLVSTLAVASPGAVGASPMFQGLGDLTGGPFSSEARGISADGSVVTGHSRTTLYGGEAMFWTESSGMVGIGGLTSSFGSSAAFDVSADGTTIVGESGPGYPTNHEAFRWTEGEGMIGLGILPGRQGSKAYGVSDDGAVIVGGFSTFGEAWRWTSGGGMVGLGLLPGWDYSVGRDVSADGSVVVGYNNSDPLREAFRWTQSNGVVGLEFLPGGGNSAALGISADGSVIVGEAISTSDNNRYKAFIWDEANGMRAVEQILVDDFGIDLTGWRLEGARDISDDGLTIVGIGRNPSGFTEGWIATIPEPGTALLLGCGLLGLGVQGHRLGRSLYT